MTPFQLLDESLLNACPVGDLLVAPSFVLRVGR